MMMPANVVFVLICLLLVSLVYATSPPDRNSIAGSSKIETLVRLKGGKQSQEQIHSHPILKDHDGIKYHAATAEKLDRTKILHRVRALLEDPLVDLIVGLVAASVAMVEVCRDVTSLSGHHGVFLLTLVHAMKALVTVVVESRRGIKGYNARFHN